MMAPGPASVTWKTVDGYKLTTGEKYTAEQQKIFQDEGFKEYYIDFTLDLQTYENLLSAMYSQVSYLCLYCHNDKDEFVGFARSAIRGNRIWVAGLAIVPAFRSKGVGKIILKEYLNLLRERSDTKTVQLECIIPNVRAHKLYLSQGFRDTFELRDYQIKNSKALPEGDMTLSTTVSDHLDLRLPWLQYRTGYSWQREMSVLLNSCKGMQQVVVKEAEELVAAFAIETVKDPLRIVGYAFEKGSLTSETLGNAIRAAHAAMDHPQKGLEVRVEPDFSEVIPLLDGVSGCEKDTRFEEYHMVLDMSSTKSS